MSGEYSNSFSYASVIVTFNRKDLLVQSARSVLLQSCPPNYLIIVDNASNDGTKEKLLSSGILSDKHVKYIRLDKNMGGSGGFYKGLEYVLKNTNVQWVSLSDDDAIYLTNYFEKIKRASEKFPGDKAFAGRVEFPDHEIQLGHRKFIKDNGRFSSVNVPESEYKKESFEVDFASFVGLVISTDLIKKIGLPEKKYFIWFDDLEYSLRIKKFTKIIVISKACIIHKTTKRLHGEGPEKGNFYNWKQYYGYRNRILLIKKHSSIPQKAIFEVIIGILRKQFFYMMNKRNKDRGKVLKQSIEAIKDGILGKKGRNPLYLPHSKFIKNSRCS